jgi:hypothetical protein
MLEESSDAQRALKMRAHFTALALFRQSVIDIEFHYKGGVTRKARA